MARWHFVDARSMRAFTLVATFVAALVVSNIAAAGDRSRPTQAAIPRDVQLLPSIARLLTRHGNSEDQTVRSRWITSADRHGVSWGWITGGSIAVAFVFGTFALACVRRRRRMESDRLHLEHTRFDLRELIDSLSGVFAARAASKDVVLRSIVDWRLAATFHGDPIRIRQIVSNLASNAIKFTDHGSVTLRVELAQDFGARQKLLFIVTDTGIGIDAHRMARLFQRPLKQAEESASRRVDGAGPGLSISRRLAGMMGGEVRLESSPGVGTRAILEIPLKVAERALAIPEFAGKLAALACMDDAREEELSNALSALGFRVIELEAGDFDEPLEDVKLFVTTPGTARLASRAEAPCLLADDSPARRMVREERGCIVVPTAPLLWRSLQEACHAALGTTPPVRRHLGQDEAAVAGGAAPATPSPDPLAQLRNAIRDPRDLKAFLEDLLDASREDLARLGRIRRTTQDQAAQRELLHRIEGALAVLDGPSGSSINEDATDDRRTQAAVAGVERLASLLRQLDADIDASTRT